MSIPVLPGQHTRLLRVLLEEAATRAGYRAARLFVVDNSRRVFAAVAAIGPSEGYGSTVTLDDPLVVRALESSGPVSSVAGPMRGSEFGGSRSGSVVLLRISDSETTSPALVAFTDPETTGPVTAEQLACAAETGVLLSAALAAAREMETLRLRCLDLERDCHAARSRAAVDDHLDVTVGAGEGMSAIVRECSELSGKSVLLFDIRGRIVAAAAPDSASRVRTPTIEEILAGHGPVPVDAVDPVVVTAGASTGLPRRKILTAVVAQGEHFGWLVLDEHPTPLRPLDEYVAARVARRIGAQFLIQRRIARVAWNARSSLTRQLVRGTGDNEDLAASGEYLGINTAARRVLAYVLHPEHRTAHDNLGQELAARMERALAVEVLATRGSEGILLLVEAPDRIGAVSMVAMVKTEIGRITAELCPFPGLIVGVSSVCEPAALGRAYREAREVAQCIDRFTGQSAHRILAVDDLGPARLFLANGESSAVRSYVDDVLGPLLSGDSATNDLLRTLQCWFDSSRSVRVCAARLGVHENTIRLRLARVHTLTGLDVAGDANDQLGIQTALLVLRLQGHPALAPVDERAARDCTADTDNGRRSA